MITNPFTEAVAAVLKLAEERCKEHPECQHMTIQRDDLARVIAREDRVIAEMKVRADRVDLAAKNAIAKAKSES